ncbi:unnamed protein product [Kuraishia capsulata CBS 1993]|uniref:ER membrane protein complex subunit 7 beta-sandwich domain-containing protein n=1 Tax=Kuraishia capsulata CBS 1993 TaxID=1382522 RepID=W6MGX0_9ASCO|nr:uncharacterized protein KUCA_T00001108001 [Kuraishia capsulata CBS 1993]CDK25141.1 unnamed protein product [Kuraishia capsulata CBS 1993]
MLRSVLLQVFACAVALCAAIEGSLELPSGLVLDPARSNLRLVGLKDGLLEDGPSERFYHFRADGTFEIPNVETGKYFLSIGSLDFALAKFSKLLVEVDAEQTVQIHDLEPGLIIDALAPAVDHPLRIPARLVRIRNYIEVKNKGISDTVPVKFMKNHKGATVGLVVALLLGVVPQLLLYYRPDLFADDETSEAETPRPEPIQAPTQPPIEVIKQTTARASAAGRRRK